MQLRWGLQATVTAVALAHGEPGRDWSFDERGTHPGLKGPLQVLVEKS